MMHSTLGEVVPAAPTECMTDADRPSPESLTQIVEDLLDDDQDMADMCVPAPPAPRTEYHAAFDVSS
jgi:hypothetical protein